MTPPPIRWGILGAADIARKNWRAIQLSGNGIVSGIASRELIRAEKFIAENQATAPFAIAPRAFGSYDELLASKEIEAVYIPLPTGLRKEWVIRAAAAGKHIVCEKPCATNVADLREMLDACQRHRVQFMDGVMFMHGRRLVEMRKLLDDGRTVGELRRVSSSFCFHPSEDFLASNIRTHGALEPLGAFGDLGWYCVRFSLWAAGWRLPLSVRGKILARSDRRDSPAPVPTEFSGELFFDDDFSAGFYCGLGIEFNQWAWLNGTHGSLRIDDFVLPKGEELAFYANGTRIAVAEHGTGHVTAQETNLFRNFSNQVRSGMLNETWPDFALKTQQAMNACLDSALAGGREMPLA